MICSECSKTILCDEDEIITFDFHGERKFICPDCQSDSMLELYGAYTELRCELRLSQKPVITSKVYPEYNTGSKAFTYYLHYAYPHGERILNGIISGNSEQDVMNQLSELRKAVYGVA